MLCPKRAHLWPLTWFGRSFLQVNVCRLHWPPLRGFSGPMKQTGWYRTSVSTGAAGSRNQSISYLIQHMNEWNQARPQQSVDQPNPWDEGATNLHQIAHYLSNVSFSRSHEMSRQTWQQFTEAYDLDNRIKWENWELQTVHCHASTKDASVSKIKALPPIFTVKSAFTIQFRAARSLQ